MSVASLDGMGHSESTQPRSLVAFLDTHPFSTSPGLDNQVP